MKGPRAIDRMIRYMYQHRVATHIWLFGLLTFLLAVLK